MRPLLVSTFDLGASFGISDRAFKDKCLRPPASLGDVGIDSPLGWGSTVVLQTEAPVVEGWRSEALHQVHRLLEEEALGWSADLDGPATTFEASMAELVAGHPIEHCALTVYSVGVVYVHLRFGPGIPVRYCDGLLNCFEYAGYTPQVSNALHAAAAAQRDLAAKAAPGPLEDLTRRPAATIRTDAEDYEESTLFTYFRHVALGIDPGDKTVVDALLSGITDAKKRIDFELHGCLHYSSGLFVFEAKGLSTDADATSMQRDAERILADIEVTHVFAGVCNAYSTFVLDAIRRQVDAYSGATPERADPQRLNRLRAMSLAVVNLTRYDLISVTQEDRKYFAAFEAEEKLKDKHAQITGGVDVLYNVQAADEQDETGRRSELLNMVLLALTSMTLISVLVDSYNFVGADKPLVSELVLRAVLLLLLLLFLGVVLFRLIRNLKSGSRAPRRSRRARSRGSYGPSVPSSGH